MIVLVSTYESGHQPLALAQAAAHLEAAGFSCRLVDLSVESLPPLDGAEIVGISVPMHTALRLAAEVAERVPDSARLCFFGLYAPLHEAYLRKLGADAVLGGECEEELVAFARGARPAPVTLRRLPLLPPSRGSLPPLDRYAKLIVGSEERVAGYVEATRGCKHRCRHCPIPAVYDGRFFAVSVENVLADVRAQIEMGARHITFGDPDFLNGPGHAIRVARSLPPGITWDATIKVEHILAHASLFPEFARRGLLFVTSAVESLDDRVLGILDKGHTAVDVFAAERILAGAEIGFRPTFVPFTPWETRAGFEAIARFVAARTDSVAPVQLSLRLLVPPGSLLLEHMGPFLGSLDEARLTWTWRHPDPAMDELQARIERIVHASDESWAEIFALVGVDAPPRRAPAAYLSEPWFC